MRLHPASLLLALPLVSGCAPYVYQYYDIEAAKKEQGYKCGIPDYQQIAFNGIYISLGINRRSHYPSFTLDVAVPEGHSARFLEDNIEIIQISQDRSVTHKLKIETIGGAYTGFLSPTQSMTGSSKTSSNIFGSHVWHQPYWFKLSQDINVNSEAGTVILPGLVINGVRYDDVKFNFKKRSEFAVAAINGC